jgi:soluble lytic murein transglycosylase-like protein
VPEAIRPPSVSAFLADEEPSMEKRPKKALARTLSCGQACAKLFLIAVLFIPALHAVPRFAPGSNEFLAPKVVNADRGQGNASKKLVKIYAIVRSHRPEITEAETWRLAQVISEESSKRRVDPLLVLALIRVESGFRFNTVSPMGARGIMQIMPDTGRFLAESLAGEYGFHPAAFTPEALDDPVLNLRLGIYYLHDLKKQFAQLNHALTAYNFGPSHTQSRLENNLELSERYAALVLSAYQRYQKGDPPRF